jgi:polyisoprenoid-binding protein YceI
LLFLNYLKNGYLDSTDICSVILSKYFNSNNMQKTSFAILIIASLFLSAFTTLQSISWKISEGYSIKFTSKNPEGVFSKFKGDIIFDPEKLESSSFNVAIDVASINTGNGMKNKHAKSAKWFDAATYPEIRFVSNKFAKVGASFEVTGVLDMHGVQKTIVIPFTFDGKNFAGTFNVNRLDYKIGTNKGMSANAATDLKIDVVVPVSKK